MLRTLQEKAELLNSQYIEYNDSINRLTAELQRNVEMLGFAPADLEDARQYIKDKVTIFRYLRYCDFDEEKTIERVMDTILWRQENNIAHLTWQSVPTEFFENGFAFFHKHDRLNRPVAVVRMRYFPQFRDKSKTLTDLIRPYACLVMEMARKMMLDITEEREQRGEARVLVSQIVVIIDIGKAPFIPIDTQLVQTIMEIMDKRFPGFVGSIYVMNFGWMYQGLWQMIKYLLNDEARSRISFPSAKEVLEIVAEENLLEELGGKDDYIWGFENDAILDKYGHGPSHIIEQPALASPALTPTVVRSSRSASLSSDEFFDAPSYLSEIEGSASAYATPGTVTPTLNAVTESSTVLYLPVLSTRRIPPSGYSNIYNWTGLHMGAAFLTSFMTGRTQRYPVDQGIDSLALANRLAAVQQERLSELREDKETFENHELAEFRPHTPHFPHLLPPDDPQSAYALAPVRVQVVRIEQKLLRLTRRFFRLSFAYKGAVYWVLLYIFLRGPVEHVVRRSVAAIISTPQKITYTTIGVTAAMAAAIGSSITASLGIAP